MGNEIKTTIPHWYEIHEHGMPPKELRCSKFLIKGGYSVCAAYVLDDGSGFCLPDDFIDVPQAWAIIEGF